MTVVPSEVLTESSEGALAPHDPLVSINNRCGVVRHFLEHPKSFRGNHSDPNRFRFRPNDLGSRYKNVYAKSYLVLRQDYMLVNQRSVVNTLESSWNVDSDRAAGK